MSDETRQDLEALRTLATFGAVLALIAVRRTRIVGLLALDVLLSRAHGAGLERVNAYALAAAERGGARYLELDARVDAVERTADDRLEDLESILLGQYGRPPGARAAEQALRRIGYRRGIGPAPDAVDVDEARP